MGSTTYGVHFIQQSDVISNEQLHPLTTRLVTAKHKGEELTVRDLDVSMLVTTYDNPILLEDRTVTKRKDLQGIYIYI